MKNESSFEKNVFDIVKKIPRGKILTYKQIAIIIKKPKAYRAVGNVLNKNKNLITIPCHRVIRSNGQIGGYILGMKEKEGILRRENIEIKNGCVIDINKYLFKI